MSDYKPLMNDLVTRLRDRASACDLHANVNHQPPGKLQELLREAADALEGRYAEHRKTLCECATLKANMDGAKDDVAYLKAKLAKVEQDRNFIESAADSQAMVYIEEVKSLQAKLAEAETELKFEMEVSSALGKERGEARAEAAAMRATVETMMGQIDDRAYETGSAALSQSGPGAAYQAYVRKLEAVAEALNRVPACRLIEIREDDEIDLFPLLAALEDKT